MSEEHILAHSRGTISMADAPYRTAIQAGHHDLTGDEPVTGGGGDAGASPFGLVLAGLSACTTITLRMYAERKGWTFTGLTVELSCYREDKAVKIDRVLTIEGLDAEQKQRMAEIAEKTPVTLALKTGIPIKTTLAG